ncbi:sensor histidine kinase [Novosphingobium mangrovi (ex Huang et al. 2023)]|uniref:histidine kinase n=1 Tax=Novosphingobium mangrovi (ex Huang et al. 2023) TaxID=2976432 RepID=A0ABT2I429_9SPHN|nr:stimulus-sensing domain-containing protein [Novosphingobium mangrovi (ex Huang et al. 2023)]MCT2399388.1 sensor N-terminal transmembrane domain-containing protein [Novosphingobium mangrovi (ex Huang et al. 2023)]
MADKIQPAAPRGHRSALASRLGLPWRISLTARILAVNIIALALLAGSLFYIDSYRRELLAERYRLARSEADITAAALADESGAHRLKLMSRISAEQDLRLRLFAGDGRLVADSFELGPPSYSLIDPATEPWYQDAARMLDRGMDFLLGAPAIPAYHDPADRQASAWPELASALRQGKTLVSHKTAPDQTPVIIAATPVGTDGSALLVTRNARDITENVRMARQTLAFIVGGALGVSILLSLFLARTIVEPLRKLVRAAVRVRLGRDRSVVVPRLPDRRDEIGLLARAISDMSGALRQRIDAVESFAADVAHELKNPLTSLRSALESLDRVKEPDLRRQLIGVAQDDVRRIDFLVTEIADASRIDAQLSRTTFEPVDMLRLVQALVAERDQRGVNGSSPVAIVREGSDPLVVPGDPARLERVLQNLLDNAVSFSPVGSPIEITLSSVEGRVKIAVSDRGPGIPASARERIFERFHSLRPSREEFGKHSGLGLAIARTIIEAHFGKLVATDRTDGAPGARLVISLPTWDDE